MWLDVSTASPPPPDWSKPSTPGLSVIFPSFARPENLHVQLFYLLRLPVMQHPSSEILIAHGSRRSHDHRALIDSAVLEACGPGANQSGRLAIRNGSALAQLSSPHPIQILRTVALKASESDLGVLEASEAAECDARKVRHVDLVELNDENDVRGGALHRRHARRQRGAPPH